MAKLRSKLEKNEVFLIAGVFENETKQLIELIEKLHNKTTKLKNIKQQISEKVKYEDTLQKLLSSSQNVIVHLKEGKCPLCGFDYQEYEILLRHVSDNTVLTDSLKKDEERKHKIESEIINVEKQKKSIISDLIIKINDHYNIINHERSNILNIIKLLELSMSKLKKERQENEECINTKFSDLLSVSENEKRQFYEELIYKYVQSLDSLKVEDNNRKIKKYSLVKDVETYSRQIISLSEKLSKLELDELYQEYSAAISDIELTNKTLEIWKEELKRLLTKEKEIKGLVAECKTKLEYFNEKGINAIEEFVCQQTHDSLASQYKEINSQFLKTIHFLITECNASELEKNQMIVPL